MRKFIFVSICILTLTASHFAQAPNTQWQKIFIADNLGTNVGNSVQQTQDSGYIITGYTRSSLNATDVFLIKANKNGASLWNKKFNENNGVGNSVIQTSDMGYIIVGSITRPSDGMTDLLLIKTNSVGEIVWRKIYGLNNQRDVGFEVRQTIDNGLIISGGTFSNTSNRYGIWLIKTDENGDSLWTKTYCGNYNVEEYASVKQTNDGGYIIVGSLNITGDSDICLIKTNENGDTLWTRTYGGEWHDYGRSVQQTIDGGFILVGYDELGDYDPNILLMKTNEFGDTLWTRTFNIEDDFGRSVIQTIDGGFLVCGFTYSNSSYTSDAWLIRTDGNGNMLWTKIIGSPSDEIAMYIQQTIDKGFVFAGSRKLTGSTESYIWLVKLEPENIVGIEENLIDLKAFKISQNYPNPFNPSTKISWQSPVGSWQTLKVFDVLGNEVATLVNEYRDAGKYETEFNAEKLSSGVYYYQLRAGDPSTSSGQGFVETKKMIYLK